MKTLSLTWPCHSVIWPVNTRRAVDAIAIVFAQAYMLARERMVNHSLAIVRLMAQRDQAITETRLLQRELGVLRRNHQTIPPLRRPQYVPSDRFEILQLMSLRGWNIQKTADRFVLHRNTVWDSCGIRFVSFVCFVVESHGLVVAVTSAPSA